MTAPLRIALVARSLGAGGGAAGSARSLARWLLERGHRVTAIVAATRGSRLSTDADSADPDRFEVRSLPVPGRGAAAAVAFGLAAARMVRATGCFDVVHAHTRCGRADVWRVGGLPHARWMRMGALRHLSPAGRLLAAWERRWIRQVSRVVAVSDVARREASRAFGIPSSRIAVVPNSVDTERFSPARRRALRERVRHELGVAPEQPVIVAVGHGYRFKGVHHLVDAMAGLPGAVCLIVGKDGAAWRFRLRGHRLRVADRIRWLGDVARVEEPLAAADVLCHAADVDPCPNAVLEGAAMGLAIVASTGVGSAEVLPPEARSLPEGTVSGRTLAQTLRPLLRDPSLRTRCGVANREAVKALAWEAPFVAFERCYAEVAHGRARQEARSGRRRTGRSAEAGAGP